MVHMLCIYTMLYMYCSHMNTGLISMLYQGLNWLLNPYVHVFVLYKYIVNNTAYALWMMCHMCVEQYMQSNNIILAVY